MPPYNDIVHLQMRESPMRIALLLIPGALAAVGCAPPDREADVRAFIDEAVEAAESRSGAFFRAHIDEAFADGRGRDRDQVLDLIRGYFFVNQDIEVLSRIERIELDGDDFAVAVIQAAVIGGRGGLDVDASLRRVELELARDGGDWTVIGASWDRLVD
jgi:hypothetical protein